MKPSIRRRLFMQIGGLVLLLISLLIIANNLLMEPYYTWQKKQELLAVYEKVSLLSEDEYTDASSALSEIEANTGFDLAIFTQDNSLLYTNNNKLKEAFDATKPVRNGPPKHEVTLREKINDQVTIVNLYDPGINIYFVALDGQLTNGHRLHLQFPLATITASISIVNQFLLFIGVILLLIALLVAYLISVSFTEPIRSMSHVTKSMTKMDFSNRCQITDNDELGQLAESINELSDELEKSLSDLQSSNHALAIKVAETKELANKRKILLSNVSHELKTPLSLIQGYTEGLMVFAHEQPEKADQYASIIHDETLKMNALIERLLDIEQIESGQLMTKLNVLDINTIIESQIDKLKPFIEQDKVDISFKPGTDVRCPMDEVLMAQAVLNLLTNAIHHSTQKDAISIETFSADGGVIVEVSNPSETLAEETLEALWDSFFKVDESRSRQAGGHGLGLSIVKAIIDAHQGKCNVRQDNGIIYFTLVLRK